MPDIDMAKARIEHGHAQAAAESKMRSEVGNRFATVSLEQGHRRGWWEGVEYGADHAGEIIDARGEAEALYPFNGDDPDLILALRAAYRAGAAREGRATMRAEAAHV
jgi:hypothetical protein